MTDMREVSWRGETKLEKRSPFPPLTTAERKRLFAPEYGELPRLSRQQVEERYAKDDLVTKTPDFELIDIVDPEAFDATLSPIERLWATDAFYFVCGRNASGTTTLCRTITELQEIEGWRLSKRVVRRPIAASRGLRLDLGEEYGVDMIPLRKGQMRYYRDWFLIRYWTGLTGTPRRKQSGFLLSSVYAGIESLQRSLTIMAAPAAMIIISLFFQNSRWFAVDVQPEDHRSFLAWRGLPPEDASGQTLAGYVPNPGEGDRLPGRYVFENRRYQQVRQVSERKGVISLKDILLRRRVYESLREDLPAHYLESVQAGPRAHRWLDQRLRTRMYDTTGR